MAKFRDNVETGGGGEFIKLKDKEFVHVIFMGEPYEYSCVWKDNKYQKVPDDTPKAKFRFRMNAVVKENNGEYVPKIFEQGATVYNMLKALNDEYQGLESVIIKITRSGSAMNDTEYSLLPLRQEVPATTKAVLAKLTLLKLEHDTNSQANGADHGFGEPPPDFSKFEEIPF